jgi:hypothetical protein
LVLLAAGIFLYRFQNRPAPVSLPPAQTYDTASNSAADNSETQKTSAALPAEVNLAVPFAMQAPHQNWSLPYQQFCEEASTLMAASYINGQTVKDASDADQKLLGIKDFEDKRLGFYEDTNADETAIILREYFGISKVDVVPDPAAIQIRIALSQGKIVIVPLAGRQLGNPFYRNPGPLYHMLVVKGYTKNGDFVTNDPGTRRGADYIYNPDVLLKAIHDWNGGNVEAGRKVMIVVG